MAIQNDPSAAGEKLQGVRANELGTDIRPMATFKDVAKMRSYNQDNMTHASSFNPFSINQNFGESKYDYNTKSIDDLQNLDLFRASEQSPWLKGINAALTGVVGGLATAIEDVSYLLDFQDHARKLGLLDRSSDGVSSNMVADWAKKVKDGLYDAFPIYEDPNTTGVTDSFLRWSTLRAGLDSVVGFGLGGLGVGAAVKGAQVLLKASKLGAMSNIVARGLTGQGMAGEALTSGASGLLQNYSEGKMIALEFIDNAKQNLQQSLAEEAISQGLQGDDISAYITEQIQTKYQDYDDILADGADKVVAQNKWLAALDIMGLHGIFKGTGLTRSLLKERGFKSFAKSFGEISVENPILQGMKEAAEEMSQNAFQSESEYQSKLLSGQLSELDQLDYDNSYFKRILKFSTSDQALVEGMMGFFSGGPQRIMMKAISGDLTKGARQRYDQAFNEQQDEINTYTREQLKDIITADALKSDSMLKNDEASFNFVSDTLFGKKLVKAFELGSTAQLENSLSDIAIMDASEAQSLGYDTNYQEQANRALETLKMAENVWIGNSEKVNRSEIMGNRVVSRNMQNLKETINQENISLYESLNKDLSNTFNEDIKFNEKSDINQLTDQQRQFVENSDQYKKIKENDYKTTKVKDEIVKLQKEYKKMISPAGIRAFQQQKAQELLAKIHQKANEEISKRNGQIVVNPKDSEIDGQLPQYKIYKKDGEQFGSLYSYDNKTKGFTNKVKTIESMDELLGYEVEAPQAQMGEISAEESKQIKSTIDNFKDADELVDYINSEIKPKNLAGYDLIKKYALDKYNSLTEDKAKNLSDVRYQNKVYKNKKTGQEFIVTRDKQKDTYFLNPIERGKNKNIKGRVITLNELNQLYEFKEAYKQNNKPNKVKGEKLDDAELPQNLAGGTAENQQTNWFSTARKMLNVFFRSTTGTYEVEQNGQRVPNPNQHQRRFFSFVNKTNLSKSNYTGRVQLVTKEFEGIVKSQLPAGYNMKDMLMFFIVDDNGNYIDGDGNATSDLNKAVWSTIRLPITRDGEGDALFANVDELNWQRLYPAAKSYEEAMTLEQNDEKYNIMLTNQLREMVKQGPIDVGRVSKSVGMDNHMLYNGDPRSFMEALGVDRKDVVLNIAQTDTLSIGGETYSVHPGYVYVEDRTTGNIYKADIKKLSNDDISTIISLIKYYVSKSKVDGGKINKADKTRSTVYNKEGKPYPNKSIWGIISEMAYWTGNNAVNGNVLNSNPKTSFYLLNDTTLRLGENAISMFQTDDNGNILSDKQGNAIINEGLTQALFDFLSTQYSQLSSNLNKQSGKYYKTVGIDENGQIQTKEYSSYSTYALEELLTTTITPQNSQISGLPNSEGMETVPTKVGQYVIFNYPKSFTKSLETKVENKKAKKDKEKQSDITSKFINTTANSVKDFIKLSEGQDFILEMNVSTQDGSKMFNIPFSVKNGKLILTNKEQAEDGFIKGVFNATQLRGFSIARDVMASMGAQFSDIKVNVQKKENLKSKAKPKVEKPEQAIDSIEKEASALASKYGTGRKSIIIPSTSNENLNPPAVDPMKPTKPFGKKIIKKKISRDNVVKEEIELMKVWFQEKFPDIEFSVIEKAIQNNVQGEFIDGTVRIYSGATAGTVYHEAFHVVYNMFTTSNQRQRLIAEAKSDPFMKDYIQDAKENYSELSGDDVIEEALADAFADYMFGIKSSAPVRESLFKRMLKFIKEIYNSLFGEKNKDNLSYINNAFKNINDKRFTSSKQLYNPDGTTKLKKIKGWDYRVTKDAIDGVQYFFMEFLNDHSPYGLESLFALDKKENSKMVSEAYKYAKSKMQQTLDFYISEKNDLMSDETASIEARQLALEQSGFDYKINGLQYTINNWDHNDTNDSITDVHKEYLNQFKIELSGDYISEEAITEVLGEHERGRETAGNQWGQEIKFSSKLNSSRSIKLLISSLSQLYAEEVKTQNEDGTTSSDTVVDHYENSLGLPTNVTFGHVFNLLSNELSNMPANISLEALRNRINNIALKEPSLYTLVDVLGLNEDISSMTQSKMNTLLQFAQTFTKNKNIYDIILVGANGQFVRIDANSETVAMKIRNEWANNELINRNSDDLSRFFIEKDGNVTYNGKEFTKEFKNINKDNISDFYAVLGINFSSFDPSTSSSDAFMNKSNSMLRQIKKGDANSLFNRNNDNDFKGDLDYIINLEVDTNGDRIENSHFNIDGERVYDNVLNSYWSNMINHINEFNSYEEMMAYYPHLNIENSPYLSHSIILRDLFHDIKSLQLSILEGSKEIDSNIGKQFEDLKTIDKLLNVINMTMSGKFNMLRPADNSLERFYSIGKQFVSSDQQMNDFSSIMDIFVGYLQDELYRSNENETLYKNYNDSRGNQKNGVYIDILKSYGLSNILDDILSGKEFDGSTNWSDFVDSKVENNRDVIISAFREFLGGYVNNILKSLENNKAIIETKGQYKNNGINGLEENVSADVMYNHIELFAINDMIGITEQHKLFFGDPSFYKTVGDEFKRHNGAVSTKKTINTSQEVNDWIAENMARSDRDEPLMSKSEIGGNAKPIIRTIVFEDVMSYSRDLLRISKSMDGDKLTTLLSNHMGRTKADIQEQLDNNIDAFFNENEGVIVTLISNSNLSSKAYTNMTEGDGAGYITLDEYREMMFRSGDWNMNLEKLYQWEMNVNNETGDTRTFYDPNTKTSYPIKYSDINGAVFNSVKPQYFGPMAEKGFRPTMYKLSLQPLIPSVIKGTNLEKLDNTMRNNQVGISVHYSANKGVTTKLNNDGSINRLYNDNGEYNLDSYGDNLLTQDTFYEFWGVQLDTGFKSKNSVVTGTQMMKQVIGGLISNGEVAAKFESQERRDHVRNLVNEYIEKNSARIDLGYDNFIEKLGLNNGFDYSNVTDVTNLINTLIDEAISRNSPDNTLQAIYSIARGVGVDELANREKIENIIMSLADSMITSQKRNGKSSYQQTSTGFEAKVSRNYNDGQYSSSDLSFYINENGKVTSMEVYLPNYFKDNVPLGSLDKRLLQLIGFRIPTQGLSSIDAITVKGFLDKSAGDIVVMPTEIVAKTGSD